MSAPPSWRAKPVPDTKEDVVLFGAVCMGLPLTTEWKLVTDAIEFATTDGDLVPGDDIEEIRDGIDRFLGGEGLLSWVSSPHSGWAANPQHASFKRQAFPKLRTGADAFAAAKLVEGQQIAVQSLYAPGGADGVDDPDYSRSWAHANRIWVWEGFVYFGSGHRCLLAYESDPDGLLHQRAKKETKQARRRIKARARRKKKEFGYTTLPAVKARAAYKEAVGALNDAMEGNFGQAAQLKVASNSYLSSYDRATVLTWTAEIIVAYQKLDSTSTSSFYMDRVRVYFQPLHEKWDVAQEKADAKYIETILALLWPDDEKYAKESDAD